MISVGTAAHTTRALERSSAGGMSSQGWNPWLWPTSDSALRSRSISGPPDRATSGSSRRTASGTWRCPRTSAAKASLSARVGRWPSNSRNQMSSSERLPASSTAEYSR
jgi:hypothetical protein